MPHVTLSGDLTGEYIVRDRRDDGTLVLVPESEVDVRLRSHGLRAATPSEAEAWCCHGCGAAGAIYDLASVLQGGPTGQWLRGEQFRHAREAVAERFRPIGAADPRRHGHSGATEG